MSELKLKKTARKENWLKNAGGEAGIQFLGTVVDNLSKEAEDKMLEKNADVLDTVMQSDTEVSAEVVKEVADAVAETKVVEKDEEVKNEEVVVEPVAETKEDVKEVSPYVTAKELEEVVDTTIDVFKPIVAQTNAQTERINSLETLVKELTEKVEKLEKGQAITKEIEAETIPVASAAARMKQKALAELNSFDFGSSAKVESDDKLLKQKPVVKVEAEQVPPNAFANFFSGQ